MSKNMASDMRWHKEKCVDDGVLRHPTDAKAWKEFAKVHKSFSKDLRNVRLGLASDGFNPFSNMSTFYSTEPVVLMSYNLPPWKCMKNPFFIMSLLIPGPKSPRNDIDVVVWTINDFPTYGNLSGWSIKGFLACPTCNKETSYMWLKNGRKTCYMGHHRFLPSDQIW